MDGSPLEILSDGTESYFYGSLYFDGGADNYANDIAGLMQYYGSGSRRQNPGDSVPHFSAYRFHDSELLLWHHNVSLVRECDWD